MSTLRFFHLPDTAIFHGISGSAGFTFADCRALTNDADKIKRLKERLDTYYINSLKDINHPFVGSIMTCVGIEVLGQVVLGFNSEGETIPSNTIKIYEMLDAAIPQTLSTKFKVNYNRNRNELGASNDFTVGFTSYAHVIRKGLRNSFTHNYRSLGVFLDDAQKTLMVINENDGFLIINPAIFKRNFIICYENCFNTIFSNSNSTYKLNALNYFNLLLK